MDGAWLTVMGLCLDIGGFVILVQAALRENARLALKGLADDISRFVWNDPAFDRLREEYWRMSLLRSGSTSRQLFDAPQIDRVIPPAQPSFPDMPTMSTDDFRVQIPPSPDQVWRDAQAASIARENFIRDSYKFAGSFWGKRQRRTTAPRLSFLRSSSPPCRTI